MLIGEDYERIAFEFMGLDLLEPNAFIGDTILFVFSMYFAYKVSRTPLKTPFFLYWRAFFLIFGIGFFIGGFGHLFYNYLGIPGKIPSWNLGIISSFCIERAMISIFPDQRKRRMFNNLSSAKMLLALATSIVITSTVDLSEDYTLGMLAPTINSTIGLIATLGGLGYYYAKHFYSGMRAFYLSVIILFPAAVLQGMKINFAQWFDKNDTGHLLLVISLFFYYAGVKAYERHLQND